MQRTLTSGAAVEQEVGDRDGLRLVKWLLTVSSSRVNERGVGVDERLQLVEPAESCRHVRRQLRTARQKKPRRAFVGIDRARCTGRSPSRFSCSRRRRRQAVPPAVARFSRRMWVARPPKSNIGSLTRLRTCADASSCCVLVERVPHGRRRRTPGRRARGSPQRAWATSRSLPRVRWRVAHRQA